MTHSNPSADPISALCIATPPELAVVVTCTCPWQSRSTSPAPTLLGAASGHLLTQCRPQLLAQLQLLDSHPLPIVHTLIARQRAESSRNTELLRAPTGRRSPLSLPSPWPVVIALSQLPRALTALSHRTNTACCGWAILCEYGPARPPIRRKPHLHRRLPCGTGPPGL